MKLGAVLLASGLSRRFGENKLLVPVEGIPLYRRTMAALPAADFSAAAVCSQYTQILDDANSSGYFPLHNFSPQEGIAASIRLGLSAMDGMDGVLFSVCDQPWLTRESTQKLAACFFAHPHCICALSWRGRRGNPVIFPAEFFPALSALTGDTGGGAVIRAHPERLLLVPAGSARELLDVDAPADLFPE